MDLIEVRPRHMFACACKEPAEAAARIEKLEDELHHCFHRINELQAALREIIGALNDPKGGQHVYDMRNASYIARKALEGKNV